MINIQGDEPLLKASVINKLVKVFQDPEVQVATLATAITKNEYNVKDCVKVITDNI